MRDWFESLTGFCESDYRATQERLKVDGNELISTVNGKRYGIGELTLPALHDLRARVDPGGGRRSSFSALIGNVRVLHSEPEFVGALFQVASQFNLLEMTSEHVTPEDGLARYEYDHTQGPACAMAAGAATIYRNYCVPFEDGLGQTVDRQIDVLAGVGEALSGLVSTPVDSLWRMQNGYALATPDGLAAITRLLRGASADVLDTVRGRLAIGLHRGVEVTDVVGDERRLVSQAFCSALPVAYSSLPSRDWELFARLILEAAYEATLLAAVEQADNGGSNIVLLTRLGGGAFGNKEEWIDSAIERAVGIVAFGGLDIRLVSLGRTSTAMEAMIEDWQSGAQDIH